MLRRLLPVLATAASLIACSGGGGAPDAASAPPDAAFIADAAPLRDGALAWVDFSAVGCDTTAAPPGDDAAADAGTPPLICGGPAPLTVTFAAIVPGAVDTFAWTFGDGAASDRPAPVHTYPVPGRYDVAVSVAGAAGTATAVRAGFIEVTAAALGAACSRDDQCAAGDCLCGDGACPPGLSAGLCTAACGTGCDDGVCGVLGAGGGADWAGRWCLAPCGDGEMCPDGRSCEVVAADGGGWVRACLPTGALVVLGGSCAAVDGLDDARCASGDCLGIGARGACSLPCGPASPCPDDARCAAFRNGVRACVAACSDGCGDDPWLGCEAAGAPGAWGFSLDGAGTVCAPRRCDQAADCAGGACVDGHCGPA